MSNKRMVTKAYTIFPNQVAVIKQTAKDNGQSSDSAALRFIIDDWVRRILGEADISVIAAYAEQVSGLDADANSTEMNDEQ